MTGRSPLDNILNDAKTHTSAHSREEREEIDASRRAIEADLAHSVWQEALRHDAYAQHILTHTQETAPPLTTARRPHPSTPLALRDQSSRDLNELCRLVITHSHAATDIAGLVNWHSIAPDGALVFACLLHLADRPDGALFWWQFSAGAGKSTAALCLYLLHLQRGEMRDAEHWARQATDLEHPHPTPPPAPPAVESILLRIVANRDTSVHHDDQPGAATRLALAAAIHQLNTDRDPHFGDIPQPNPDLVVHLQDCATH